MLTVNDFFCGCGGMGLGFQEAGFTIKGAWDFDKYAVESYRANVGDHVLQADITTMSQEDVPIADVWTFGFPCQDLSLAGRKAGLFEGKRSGLFFEVMRLLDDTPAENLPKIIMAENVKGLKPYLGVLAEEYEQRGYKMQYKIYNSKYWGVPQNRERYFVVGTREGVDFVFPEEQHEFVPKLSSILEKNVDEKYYLKEEQGAKIVEKANLQLADVQIEDQLEPQIEVLGMLDIKAHDHSRRVHNPKGLSPTVTAVCGGTHHIKILEELQSPVRYRVRKLTPTEYGRLQGFPMDTWEHVVSNTQAYKQFGNAVTVKVAKAVATAIKNSIEGMGK